MDTPTGSNKYLVPLAIVVAGVLVAGAIYYGDKSGAPYAAPTENKPAGEVAPLSENDHILGASDAELIIYEYSDTECPFCKVFHNTMKEVMRTYEGKVAWVYRHFPIASLHARATREAEATECAAELGGNTGFWKYIDEVFAITNSNDSLDPAELPKIAGRVGLDTAAFTTCLDSGRHSASVQKSIEDAVKAGARGTPYSVIVSKSGEQLVINGAEPLANVKLKIDSLLR
jgi:protein-disulfide isomerase